MKHLIFLCLICCINISFAQQKIDSTLTDSFDNNANEWGEWESNESVAKVENGKYFIQQKKLKESWAYHQSFQVNLNDDFSIEATLTQLEGVDNYGYGLIWAYADWNNYNSFIISPNQYLNVNTTTDGIYKELKEWTKNDVINVPDKPNILKIEQVNNTITFYINAIEVFKTKRKKFSPQGNNIGFIVYSTKKITVDDFILKGKFPKINMVANAIKGYTSENLGENINTNYSELLPVVSPDGKTLYFTRRHDPENIGSGKSDDVLYSEKQTDGTWGKYKRLKSPINNAGHNFVVSVAADNNSLIVGNTYNTDGTPKSDGLSITYKTAKGWSLPEALVIKNFYNKADYNEYSLSQDNQYLILAIQRNDSKGLSRDLYVSFRKDKTNYTEPMSLGSLVNTKGIEMTPFLASDNKTLYFSSDGHPGYGVNDIFVTRRLDESWKKWSVPENLGPEINSRAWDAYFTIPASGEEAYLVSNNNPYGTGDIVRIKLSEAAKPNPVVLIKGKVLNQKDYNPLESTIHYYEMGTTIEAGSANSNPTTGEYNIILQAGKQYTFRAAKENFYAINDFIDLSTLDTYKEIEKNLFLAPIEIGQTILLHNIFFDFNKDSLKSESYEELNRLVKFLQDNLQTEIEIAGHTDNQGSDEYNLNLSQKRAESVSNYIISKGIDKNRLTAKGFGMSKPLESNNTDEGRAINRRVEFTILKH